MPFNLDSKTTVFVASSDSAVKKSVWLIRRVTVVEEGVAHMEPTPWVSHNQPQRCILYGAHSMGVA